jgi:general stress protein 26
MPDAADLEAKFWKSIKSDRTAMLGLAGDGESLGQPMTMLLDKDAERGALYTFTARDSDLVQAMGDRHPAQLLFAGKGHDLFAAVEGELVADNDRATIERLWNPFVAAWFEGGKDDPNLQLLRFEPGRAQIWENDNSVFAGVRLLLGRDPKQDYKDKTAQVRLS